MAISKSKRGTGGLRMAEYIKREAAVKAVEKYGLTNGVVWGRHTGLAI